MKVTGDESRRNQQALVRSAGEKKPSTLSRLVPRDTIVGTLDDLERGQQELDDEMRASWENNCATER
ncbi:MAG: hypothetical protein ABSH47_09610 [Bryobacteraceae bacterium]|jgi:hypothetical protein